MISHILQYANEIMVGVIHLSDPRQSKGAKAEYECDMNMINYEGTMTITKEQHHNNHHTDTIFIHRNHPIVIT